MMSNFIILTVPKTVLPAVKEVYVSYLHNNSSKSVYFFAKKNKVTITGYKSGKIMFQGYYAQEEATQWLEKFPQKKPVKKSQSLNSTPLPKDFKTWSVIGSDEVGNGSYFGPLVVCATYVDKKTIPLLTELGVKDSKELKDEQIRKIAPLIKASIPFKELIVTPKKYNAIQPDYNVIRMKVALHNQAIFLLSQTILPTKPEGILIDQFTTENTYHNYLKKEKHPVTESLYFRTKGEKHHLAVAAASIICRASFLDALDQASQELGFLVPSGAGKKSDVTALKVLEKGGIELLGNYVKLHFANTQKAQNLYQKKYS